MTVPRFLIHIYGRVLTYKKKQLVTAIINLHYFDVFNMGIFFCLHQSWSRNVLRKLGDDTLRRKYVASQNPSDPLDFQRSVAPVDLRILP